MVDYRLLEEFAIESARKQVELTEGHIRRGWGRRDVRSVRGKPGDREISIDTASEKLFVDMVNRAEFPWHIVGEHGSYGDPQSGLVVAGDLFDGSALFEAGFHHMIYSVWSLFEREGDSFKPVFTSSLEIPNSTLSLTREEGNFELDLRNGWERRVTPSPRRDFTGLRLAAYTMSRRYQKPFDDIFGPLLDENLKSRILAYPNGGACIYSHLANGSAHAYTMVNEPRKEIDPGYYIAQREGCQIGSITLDGEFEGYRFNPAKSNDSVPLFVAAATPELRDRFIEYLQRPNVKERVAVYLQD